MTAAHNPRPTPADTIGTRHVPPPSDDEPSETTETIRSEERLHVATERIATGTARLVKHTVTEYVTLTVPVTHEEVRVEYGRIADDDKDSLREQGESSDDGAPVDGGASGADTGDEPAVILYAERISVQKVKIPVERVTLGVETVTEHETVTAQLRREKIDEPAVVVGESPQGTDFTCRASR